jgi:ribonucleoside-diphosphate reductase alpha chain
MNKALDYFNGDKLALNVWETKYKQEGDITPDDMHKRMAKEFARVEAEYNSQGIPFYSDLSLYGKRRPHLNEESIYQLFKDFKYVIPQGSVMSQLGAKSIGSLSNCVVIGSPSDSYGGIFEKDEQAAQLMKRRCGVGIDMSSLRPAETPTSNAAKTSTGAVSFMHRFSHTTREVAQNGRRGALMLSLDVRHPDILDFVKIKRDLTQVTGANISVKLNDAFMKSIIDDEDYILSFPCKDQWMFDSGAQYVERGKLTKGALGVYKKISSRALWAEIVKSARDVAEPGLMNWDRMVNYAPDGVYPQYKPETTNPCSEIAMQEGDACRLIAVNLYSFVVNPFTDEAYFDYAKFYQVNYEAMRLSDDLIDLESEHMDRILEKIIKDPEDIKVKQREYDLWILLMRTALSSRRTGLGFTALGDTLAALGLKYDSEAAMKVTEDIMSQKMLSEWDCSVDLAIEREAFDGWDSELEYPEGKPGNDFYAFLQETFPDLVKRMNKHGRRNVSVSTAAPTGSLSMLSQTSSGIEPVFMTSHTRRKKINPNDKNARIDFTDQSGDTWQEFPVLHPKVKTWAWITRGIPSRKLDLYSADEIANLVSLSPWAGATAPEIDWRNRVKMQGTIQKYISHSISSTINLPSDVTEEVVSEIYMEAWREGLKGVTVYREGSRSGVLVDNKKTVVFNETRAPKRPKAIETRVIRFNNNKEKWVAFIGIIDGKPYEMFTGELSNIKLPGNIEFGEIVKVRLEEGLKRYDFVYKGGVVEGISRITTDEFWNYGKLISGILRHGMPLPNVADTVANLNFKQDHINIWRNGVTRALRNFIKDGQAAGSKCTDCGEELSFENGCQVCKNCGYDKCG